jgi:glycosyltransferase involved in cell wall biosynthesis
MLRVSAYTGGWSDPSARFRVRQYIPALRSLGVDVRDLSSHLGSYPPPVRALRPIWVVAATGERALSAAWSYASDLTLLQKPMLSTLVTAEPLTRRPRVLDVDDAIWLSRGGVAAPRLAGLCDAVICGNDYLAEHFRKWNAQVYVHPTAVDTDRFRPLESSRASELRSGKRIIGWSGSLSGFRFLEPILPTLRVILENHRDVVFRVVGPSRPNLEGIRESQFDFIPWSPEVEVRAIQEMTVGLMPLEDTAWTRGKCSFKLLTYMACGVPAVASPVGMNTEVLRVGGSLGPNRWTDWTAAIESLLEDEGLGRRIGEQGREVALRDYSVNALAPRLAGILASCREGQRVRECET